MFGKNNIIICSFSIGLKAATSIKVLIANFFSCLLVIILRIKYQISFKPTWQIRPKKRNT